MQDYDERQLIYLASSGDTRAFETLMTQHEGRMYAVALRMCSNREDAQDCVQEAMIRAYRSMDSFKGQASFSTWIYRVTMNACLDELRRRKARYASSLDNMIEGGWSPADDRETPEQQAVSSEKKRALEKAIKELPDDMRAAIVLRDVQGFSYDQIASILKANVGTIKSRISRGREKLRETIRQETELFEKYSV